MRRTEVNEMVKQMVEKNHPNLSQNRKNDIIYKVTKTIEKDYYALDLNLKSETKRRINMEVYHGTIQNKIY